MRNENQVEKEFNINSNDIDFLRALIVIEKPIINESYRINAAVIAFHLTAQFYTFILKCSFIQIEPEKTPLEGLTCNQNTGFHAFHL